MYKRILLFDRNALQQDKKTSPLLARSYLTNPKQSRLTKNRNNLALVKNSGEGKKKPKKIDTRKALLLIPTQTVWLSLMRLPMQHEA
jgi:hypothetical protein